jgi:phospholipase/carboxylesterase
VHPEQTRCGRRRTMRAGPDADELEVMWMDPRAEGTELTGSAVARWGTGNPAAPLIVLLHGDGASENSMIELAPFLPYGPAYAAPRGPLEDGGGFAWLAGSGPGRPDPENLRATMSRFLGWLDAEGSPDRPVLLLGFGGGAVLAGGLLLTAPERWAAGVLLHGALPFDAGVPATRGRLAGLPVFLAHGTTDAVVPAELQRRSWEYLVKESGSPVWAEREAGGHQLSRTLVAAVAQWLEQRVGFLRRHGENPLPDGEDQHWPTLSGGRLPERAGAAPEVSVTTPHQQESQNAPAALQEELFARLEHLPGVTTGPSELSVPGARAFLLEAAAGPEDAFMAPASGEFAHLHPAADGSLHVVLPIALAYDALAKGWARAHPLAGIQATPGLVMIFGPRDAAELEIVAGVVEAAHRYAAGR